MRTILMTAFCGVLLVACGCEPIQPPWVPLAGKPLEQGQLPSPETLVRTSLETRAHFETLEAKATMQIRDRKQDFGLNVNVQIFAGVQPDRLRIRATKASVEAFDAVCQEDTVAFYVKRRRALYHGTLAELEQEQNVPIRPNEILENLLQPDVHLKARNWQLTAKAQRFGRYPSTILLEEAREGRRWRLYLEPRRYLIVGVERVDEDGVVSFRKQYDRYREFLRKDTAKGDVPEWYPYDIRMSWPKAEREVVIHFRRIKPNIELTDALFALEVPDNTKIKPIGQTRVQGESLKEDPAP